MLTGGKKKVVHVLWTDEGKVGRRQINQRTSKANGWKGKERNERVPPVCPMPFPLRSAWACSQISGAIVPHGCIEGVGAKYTQQHMRALEGAWKWKLFEIVLLKLWHPFPSLNSVFVSRPCMCTIVCSSPSKLLSLLELAAETVTEK